MEHHVSSPGDAGDHAGALLAALMSLVLGALTWAVMEAVRISASG